IVKDGVTQIGITHDPVHNETFSAMLGAGAFLNKTQIFCNPNTNLNRGTIGTGFSNRVSTKGIKKLINLIFEEGGMYHRNASCALSLAYVASGRLLGYIEEHLNAWDCLAGQLLISEAGGQIEKQDTNKMIQRGGRVVVGSSGVFDQLVQMANKAFKN
ncbi:inositol monophosphatase, partial [bacterium]|nr:inositol monophosphatase [bacterium]